jgi:hypothetical protein
MDQDGNIRRMQDEEIRQALSVDPRKAKAQLAGRAQLASGEILLTEHEAMVLARLPRAARRAALALAQTQSRKRQRKLRAQLVTQAKRRGKA